MKIILATFLLIFVALGTAWSQSDDAAPSSTPMGRAAVNGDTGSLAFSSEENQNLLSGGLNLSSTYDDNAFLTNSAKQAGNVGHMISPYITITEVRPRAQFMFNYTPGFTWNQRLSQRFQADHSVGLNFQYRLTERLTARVHENFQDMSTSFDPIAQNPSLPGGNILHQPNQSVITPLAKQLMNVSDLDLIDQVGEATTIGISGSFNMLKYSNREDASNVQLFNNQLWSADAFCSHQLSHKQSIGVTYTLQKIATFGSTREHTTSSSAVIFYTFLPSAHTMLSFFAGPDRVTVNDQFKFSFGPFVIPISETHSRWLVDEGMTFAWQGQRTSAQLNFIHHISDGGGLTGAVQLYSALAGLRRQLSANWTVDLGVTYGNNNPLSKQYGNAFSGISGTIGVDRNLGEHFTVAMRYGRARQRYQIYGLANTPGNSPNHNIGAITLSYRFSRPLGR